MSIFNGRGDDAERSLAIRRLKQLARELFSASAEDAVVVSELACTEPGCPPIETVVALLRAGGPPRQIKVHKAATEVTQEDLRAAIHHGHPEGSLDAATEPAELSRRG